MRSQGGEFEIDMPSRRRNRTSPHIAGSVTATETCGRKICALDFVSPFQLGFGGRKAGKMGAMWQDGVLEL